MDYVMPPHPITVVRERLGLSRVRFAKLCGITRMTVQLTEVGQITEPRKILDAIGRLNLHPDVEGLRRDCLRWALDDSMHMAISLGIREHIADEADGG